MRRRCERGSWSELQLERIADVLEAREYVRIPEILRRISIRHARLRRALARRKGRRK